MHFNLTANKKKPEACASGFLNGIFDAFYATHRWRSGASDQWNCSSSVEPVRAFTEDEPPWITVVTSSK